MYSSFKKLARLTLTKRKKHPKSCFNHRTDFEIVVKYELFKKVLRYCTFQIMEGHLKIQPITGKLPRPNLCNIIFKKGLPVLEIPIDLA